MTTDWIPVAISTTASTVLLIVYIARLPKTSDVQRMIDNALAPVNVHLTYLTKSRDTLHNPSNHQHY